jgi:hypothetical protein
MSDIQQVFGDGMPHRVAVYIPCTTKVEQETTQEEHERWVRTALTTFSALFGGATSLHAQGGWVTVDGVLVLETITIVYSYTDTLSLYHLRAVRQFATVVKEAMGQEKVSVEIDGAFFLV